jgi:hypothetical protein
MDDKQKTVAVAALAVVVVGVGAFQFLGGSSGPSSKKPKTDKAHVSSSPAGDAKKAAKDVSTPPDPLLATPLPTRDPFQEGKITNALPDPNAGRGAQQGKGIRVPGGGRIPPFDTSGGRGPYPMTGSPGALPGSLPPKPDVFSMTLAAVIVGDKPAAVFQDEQGNQRLVTLGGKIDGDSVVTSISRGSVTVSRKGKTVTLTVGAVQTNGNP